MKPYVIISSDGHAGADLMDYRPYLDAAFRDRFDVWASGYVDPWGEIQSQQDSDPESVVPFRYGVLSYDLELNWNSDARLKYTEEQGVAAEVLFPNTTPPFAPSGVLSAPGPRTPEEYELRWAGIRAHNRWLADFCSEVPGRRVGLAQLYLDDVGAAVAEIRWAKEAGLQGVVLPMDHVLKMAGLYYKAYEPIWEVCSELELPVHKHQGIPNEGVQEGSGAVWAGIVETGFYESRTLSHLICTGVFDRHPGLKFVITEPMRTDLIVQQLSALDAIQGSALLPGAPTFVSVMVAEAASALRMKASEYFARNCYIGNPLGFRSALASGLPNLMFGIDLPHSEGCSPYTKSALRVVMADVPESGVRQLTSLTAAECYGLDLDALQVVGDRIGFMPSEIADPLSAEEMPRYPDETLCFCFAAAGPGILDGVIRTQP